MVFEEFLYILLYNGRQFFDCKRGHTQETCAAYIPDLAEDK